MLDVEFEKGTVFRVVKQMVGKKRCCVKGTDGKTVTVENKVKERWKVYLETLLNEEFEWNKDG